MNTVLVLLLKLTTWFISCRSVFWIVRILFYCRYYFNRNPHLFYFMFQGDLYHSERSGITNGTNTKLQTLQPGHQITDANIATGIGFWLAHFLSLAARSHLFPVFLKKLSSPFSLGWIVFWMQQRIGGRVHFWRENIYAVGFLDTQWIPLHLGYKNWY